MKDKLEEKIRRRITVELRGPEEPIVHFMEEKGYKISEVIREQIRQWGKDNIKEPKAYEEALKMSAEIRKAKLEKTLEFTNLSEEDYATKVLHGKIIDGSRVGFKIANNQTMTMPLAGIKDQTPANNGLIDIHTKLYNRTFVFPNGQVPKPEFFDEMFKDWEETPEEK